MSRLSIGTRLAVGAVAAAGAFSTSAGAQSGTETILSTANIFASGGNAPSLPAGDLGPSAASAPTLIAITTPGSGRTLTFASATGLWNCFVGAPLNDADGGTCAGPATNISSTGSIAGIETGSRTMFLVGLFLEAGLPGAAPSRLVYSTPDLSSATFSPGIGQVFFIGDGLTGTGSGATQTFAVPDGATRLFLGIADAFGFSGPPGAYGDNTGSITIDYAIVGPSLVPEPSSLTLAATGALAMLGWTLRGRRSRG
jgi:hypothetical protein